MISVFGHGHSFAFRSLCVNSDCSLAQWSKMFLNHFCQFFWTCSFHSLRAEKIIPETSTSVGKGNVSLSGVLKKLKAMKTSEAEAEQPIFISATMLMDVLVQTSADGAGGLQTWSSRVYIFIVCRGQTWQRDMTMHKKIHYNTIGCVALKFILLNLWLSSIVFTHSKTDRSSLLSQLKINNVCT